MANSTLNKSLKSVSNIKLAPKIGGTMSAAVGTNEAGQVTSDCLVTFKQPSRAKTADPYQIQYQIIYKYTAANQKSKGAEYNQTWAQATWKNAVAVTGIAINATTNPDTWQKANRAVNTSSDYQSVMNLKGTKIASGYVAALYRFRIRTYNKKTNKHGAWITSGALTINKAAVMEGDAVHVANGLLLGFNLNWDMGGTFNIDSVKVNGAEILAAKVSSAKLSTANLRTSQTHPPKPASGYTPYNCRIPTSAFKPGGYDALSSASSITITAYWKTEQGVITYFGNGKGATMPILNDDIDAAPPRVVVDVFNDGGYVRVRAYKGEASDIIGKLTIALSYKNPTDGKWTNVSALKTTGDVTKLTDVSNPFEAYFYAPLNTELKAVATIYDAEQGNSAKHTEYFEIGTRGMFILNDMSSWTSQCATMYGDPELNQSRSVIKSTYACFGRDKPVVSFSGATERKIVLKGTLCKTMDAAERNATGYADKYATVKAWLDASETAKRYMFRRPTGDVHTVALDSVDVTQSDDEIASVTISMTEVE